MNNSFIAIALAAAIPFGMIIGYAVRKFIAAREVESAESKAEQILKEAKTKHKELILEAKSNAFAVLEAAKKEEQERRKDISTFQKRLEERESRFDQKLLDLENQQERLQEKTAHVEALKNDIQILQDKADQKLSAISELSKEEARSALMQNVEQEFQSDLVGRIRKIEEQNAEVLEQRTRTLLSTAIQRYAASHVSETTTTTVQLPSDDMKGRIIGKEGRNIKAIEQLTGVEVIVDDTPEAVVISGFNPIRRHLAKRAIEKLLADGRIHPSRIEDCVAEAKKELSNDIKKAGEDAAYEVGVVGLDPKLVHILGRLKYRTSYGQNVLMHSLEVAHIAALLAEEIGADVANVKKGGLLHDVGKAIDHEIQGGHPKIGYDIMKKFGLPEEIAYHSISHHEDSPKTIEGAIVKVADAISASRPGARKGTYEQYIQRLDDLEKLTLSFTGVEKSYAIQAGREVRVFVKPEDINDLEAYKLAREIADRIEAELQYPGEIKVNVIRETRVIEYAR